MGQFLCIGLRTSIAIRRKDFNQPFVTPEYVAETIEQRLVPARLYERHEMEDMVVYRLRNDAVQEEFIPFLKEFYKIRYTDINSGDEMPDCYLAEISKCHNLDEWLDLAEQKEMEGFQIDNHGRYVRIKDFCHVYYREESIILSLTGKAWMECYETLFLFLANCIKARLSQYQLAESISVFLTD